MRETKFYLTLLILIVKVSLSQPAKEYFYNNELSQIYHLSSDLNFVAGIDERSVDFFAKITNGVYVCLSMEEGILYLKDFATGLAFDYINLNKIPGIEIGDDKFLFNEKEYSYKSAFPNLMVEFNQINQTSFSVGLFEVNGYSSTIKVDVDTVSQKLLYTVNHLNNIATKGKIAKQDTSCSKILFKKLSGKVVKCGDYEIVDYIRSPYSLNKELINSKCQIYFKGNIFHHAEFNPNTVIASLNDTVFLCLEPDKGRIDAVNHKLEVVKTILYDSLGTEVFMRQFFNLLVDFKTNQLYLLRIGRYDKDSIAYSIFSIGNDVKPVIRKVFELTSNIMGYEFNIHNGEVYLIASNVFDRTKHIYKYKHKLSEATFRSMRIFRQKKTRNLAQNDAVYNKALGYNDIYIKHIVEKNKTDLHDLKRMPVKIRKKILRNSASAFDKSDSLSVFIAQAIELYNKREYEVLMSDFFLFSDENEFDKELLNSIDKDSRLNDEKHKGLITYMEMIKDLDISTINGDAENRGNRIAVLTTKSGAVIQCYFKDNEWYFSTVYNVVY